MCFAFVFAAMTAIQNFGNEQRTTHSGNEAHQVVNKILFGNVLQMTVMHSGNDRTARITSGSVATQNFGNVEVS